MAEEVMAVPAQVDRGVRPRAWYVERVAPGMRDHGMKLGPWWKQEQAEEWADDRHQLRTLYDQAALDALASERDGLMQTLRDEIDENLRLRELGGARSDENITAMTERLIRERDSLRAQLAIAARGLKHCAGWNINDDKRNALMAVVLESEAMLTSGPNV